MHVLNIIGNKMFSKQQNLVFCQRNYPSILVARQRTLQALHLTSIKLLRNIANKLFGTNGEIKGPLLYCFRFEKILNSWLLQR